MATMFQDWLIRRTRAAKAEKDYIEFVDPVVESICATTWGDGIGLTYAQAAAVTSLGGVFRQNTSITSFDELQYFTGITNMPYYGNNTNGEFAGCTNLVSIYLPPNVTTLTSTFNGCTNLEYVNLPSSITTLNVNTFTSCSKLAISVNLPNLTSISKYAFYGCSSITSIVSLGSITSIPGGTANYEGAFRVCSSLTSVTLPSTLTSIGDSAFRGCSSLETVSGGTVTSFGKYSFKDCSSLVTINVSNAVTIGNDAFRGTSLNGAILNMPNLTSLGTYAFIETGISAITSLGNITSIHNGNTTNGIGAFSACTHLTSVTLPSTLTSIGSAAFLNCTSLISVNIPTNVTSIGAQAFKNCPLPGILTIPQNITVDTATFLGNNYTKIIFGGNVAGLSGSLNGWLASLYGSNLLEIEFSENQTSEIGAYIVNSPYNNALCPLTTITIKAITPPSLNNYAFVGMGSLAHIYVPASAVDTYKAASTWSDRASIIEAIPS